MYRVWTHDENYVLSYYYQISYIDAELNYSSKTPPAYTAPKLVYTTSRSLSNATNTLFSDTHNLRWSFPLDSGFYYLFRLHFCETQFEVMKQNYRVFYIFIGNQTAEADFDVIVQSGGWRFPMYRDYIMFISPEVDGKRSKQNVWLVLRPTYYSGARPVYNDVILNGIEIFKLSDSKGNLSVPNPDEVHLEAPNSSPSNKKKKQYSWHIIVFIITGVIVGMAVLSILVIMNFWGRKRGKGSGVGITKLPLLPCNQCRHFLLEEIKKATHNFDDSFVIGRGGFGNVYKGYLENGTTMVAAKRLNPQSKQGVCEFHTEIEMLSKLRHLHLVSLIGYCDDNNEMILVYDYMCHGTLREHLYGTDNAPLTWKKRLEICIGAAKGLYYLHLHTGTKHTIIHRDVKSTNILLDDKWEAKVSDFGLSKVGQLCGTGNTHVSTAVKGSFGYIDPEYFKRQHLTEKSDVYSFGVVLFEVLCGRPAIMSNLPQHDQVNLADWACRCYEKGNLNQIIDPSLEGQIALECLNKFTEVAYSCLRDKGVQRPSMGDVVWTLEHSLRLQDPPHNVLDPPHPSLPLDVNHSGNENEIFSGSRYTIFSEILNPLGR